MDRDFLLENPTAQKLYHDYASGMPIIDYHCHLNPQQIAEELKTEVQDRLDKAGVQVIEARISHLAYAPEIASAMLKRQQAQAIVAARRQIVDGAVITKS